MLPDETESGPNFGFVTAPSARFWVVMQPTQLDPERPPPLLLAAAEAVATEIEPAVAAELVVPAVFAGVGKGLESEPLPSSRPLSFLTL
jgi:hypothetical protein